MQRQTLNIGNYTFICDYIKYEELPYNNILKEFVLLRNIKLGDTNGVIDNDLYFVEKDILDDISYPLPNQIEMFSTNKAHYFELCNDNLYELYNENCEVKKLKYDIIRIYKPSHKSKLMNLLVYIYNFINNINIHYYCRPWNKHFIKSETEFKYNNTIYSEYIEIYIPNMDDLYNAKTYVKENTCLVGIDNLEYSSFINNVDNNSYISTELFKLPFISADNTKTYLTYDLDKNLYFNYPVNIMLYPYENIEDSLYIPSNDYISNCDVFVDNEIFSIVAKLGFLDGDNVNPINQGELCLQMDFDYANKDNFSNVSEAYEYYNRINIEKYNGIEYEPEDEHEDYDQNGNKLTTQYQCVYVLELASDVEFKNIIYRSKFIEGITLYNDILNKKFAIPCFNSWDQLPEILVARAIFIDRYLGILLYSNFVLITKEWYKYLVKYDNSYTNKFKLTFKTMEDKINFNNRVSCIIKQTTECESLSNPSPTPTIIYKPIFYKVQDLQSIELYKGVVQNIGINLNSFLNKVNKFYITIDDQQFPESGRHGVYVLFSINSNNINNTIGNYHITNQDQEYISSGEYSII